jgi:hypothetical protein
MYQLRGGVFIDIGIKCPSRIAYVTSNPDYVYSSKRINATVTTAKDVLGCDRVIQIMVTTNREGTFSPIFIPLPNDLEGPAVHVAQNVIRTLSMLCDKIPALREAFAKVNPDNVPVPDSALDDNFLSQLQD